MPGLIIQANPVERIAQQPSQKHTRTINQLLINIDGNQALILSAIQHLEAIYRQHNSPCLALQIARHYRLLLTKNEHPIKKQYWRVLCQQWPDGITAK